MWTALFDASLLLRLQTDLCIFLYQSYLAFLIVHVASDWHTGPQPHHSSCYHIRSHPSNTQGLLQQCFVHLAFQQFFVHWFFPLFYLSIATYWFYTFCARRSICQPGICQGRCWFCWHLSLSTPTTLSILFATLHLIQVQYSNLDFVWLTEGCGCLSATAASAIWDPIYSPGTRGSRGHARPHSKPKQPGQHRRI